MKQVKIYKIVTIVVFAATVVLAIFIMGNRIGLSDNLDFGAGAYYYADIPNYDEEIAPQELDHHLPKWIFYALFFAWGALMFALWKWIDHRQDDISPDHSPSNRTNVANK